MKVRWLHNRHRDDLLVFCSGWGMDHLPFSPLGSGAADVLMLYDYQDLTVSGEFWDILNHYHTKTLIGWSMGVWVAQVLFEKSEVRFAQTLAINGTLRPIDDRFGIPPAFYDKTEVEYSELAQQKFYRRMCREQGILRQFTDHKPQREVRSQKLELLSLKRMIARHDCGIPIFTSALISSQDLVMPTKNQVNFWQNHHYVAIEGCHFPFYRWGKWDDILLSV